MIWDFIYICKALLVFVFIKIPKALWKMFSGLYDFLFHSRLKKKQKSVYVKFFNRRREG